MHQFGSSHNPENHFGKPLRTDLTLDLQTS